jgi:hypothetical protein
MAIPAQQVRNPLFEKKVLYGEGRFLPTLEVRSF